MKNVSNKKEKFRVPGEKTDGGMKRKYSRQERKKNQNKARKVQVVWLLWYNKSIYKYIAKWQFLLQTL